MQKPWPVLLMAQELGLGGSERQLAEMARALDRTCFEVHVGCFRAGGFRQEELRAAGMPVVQFPVRSFRSPSALSGAWQMGRYLRRHQVQLVHTFDVPTNLYGVPVARAFRTPVVVSSQRAHRDLTPGWRRRLLRVTDRMVDAVVVNSRAVQRQLVEEDGVAAAKIRLCHNGVDTGVFRTPGLRRGSLVIGVICALRPEKDLSTLLEAFAKVRRLRAGLRLVIVGDGPSEQSLKKHSQELGLGEDCHFEPATNRVLDWLRAIDIFVLPSLSESFSNALMEAMACGCAVVASGVGGNPELVSHEQTGLLFRPGDPDDLAECLRLLIDDEALRKRLAEAAVRLIQEHYSLETAARRMGEIYSALLAAR
jgi:glycosyltransferase involved in cell wall biosynthesis